MGLGCQKADWPNRGSSSSSSTPETGIPITAVLHRGEAYSSRKAIRFPCEIISNSESFFFFSTSVCVKAGEKYYIDDEDLFIFNDVYCILNRYIFFRRSPGTKIPRKTANSKSLFSHRTASFRHSFRDSNEFYFI